jgi:hypothetical protein
VQRHPLKIAALAAFYCLCGCHSPQSDPPAPAPPTPPPSSARASADLAVRDNSLALLNDLLNDEKRVGLILLIKRETPELKQLVKGISGTAADGARMLKEWMKEDPRLKSALSELHLPPGEVAARKAIAKTKQSVLLRSKGEEFEFQILLTQMEALNYGVHLALIAAENEPDPKKARKLSQLADRMGPLLQQVIAVLRPKPQ